MIQNINEWQLFHLAQSLTRAKRLEKHRAEFHEELYEAIVYPTMRIDPLDVRGNNPVTDTQAIRIIEAKERYDRKIQKEYDRYIRWQDLLTWVDNHDQQILIRYFQKKKYVQPKIINRLLLKIEKRLNDEESRIEQERTEQSTVDFRKYQEQTHAFRKKAAPVNEDKQEVHVLVKGRFVYMPKEEYEKQQKEAERIRQESIQLFR